MLFCNSLKTSRMSTLVLTFLVGPCIGGCESRPTRPAMPVFVKQCLDTLERDLASSDSQTRHDTISLISWNDISAPLMRTALTDNTSIVRIAAAMAPKAPTDSVVEKALKEGLYYTGKSDLDSLFIRYGCAVRLLRTGNEEAIHLLEQACNSRSDEMRLVLATELAECDDKRLIECARQLVTNSSGPIRVFAAESLARMGDPAGIEILHSTINKHNDRTAAYAAHSLGELGDKEATLQLRRLVQANDMFVQVYAAKALAALGEKEGLAVLRKCLVTRPELLLRYAILSAVAQVGTEDDITLLQEYQSDVDIAERRSVCAAVVEIWARHAVAANSGRNDLRQKR